MVRSTLEYSCATWDPFRKKDIDKFNQIHRSAARFVTSNYSRKASVSTMLKSLDWEETRNARLAFFYKILNGRVNIPVSDGLVPADERTRGANNKNFKHIRSATSVAAASYYSRTIPDWNKLPEETVVAPSVDAFKTRLTA